MQTSDDWLRTNSCVLKICQNLSNNLKKENAAIFSEKEYYLSECEHLKSENLSINNQLGVLTQELTDVKGQLYQAQQELSEAESVVQECVEEKKKLTIGNRERERVHPIQRGLPAWKRPPPGREHGRVHYVYAGYVLQACIVQQPHLQDVRELPQGRAVESRPLIVHLQGGQLPRPPRRHVQSVPRRTQLLGARIDTGQRVGDAWLLARQQQRQRHLQRTIDQ